MFPELFLFLFRNMSVPAVLEKNDAPCEMREEEESSMPCTLRGAMLGTSMLLLASMPQSKILFLFFESM
jgi:hypothetical protein